MSSNVNWFKRLFTKTTSPVENPIISISPSTDDASTLSSTRQTTLTKRREHLEVESNVSNTPGQVMNSTTFNALHVEFKEAFEAFGQRYQGNAPTEQFEEFLIYLEGIEKKYVSPGYYNKLYQTAKEFEENQEKILHSPPPEEEEEMEEER